MSADVAQDSGTASVAYGSPYALTVVQADDHNFAVSFEDRDGPGDPRAAMTRRFLEQAGIDGPMRILDVGSGMGSVAILLARMMDGQGEVVGVDREPKMIDLAQKRVAEFGLTNVTFVEGSFSDPSLEIGTFDAAVGRRVLMYQPDPVEAVRQLQARVRSGGFIFFEELDSSLPAKNSRPLPLHETVRSWVWQTLERTDTQLHMGLDLYAVFEAAGLEVCEVRAEGIVKTPTSPDDTAEMIRYLLPRIVEQDVATEAEVDIDTLDDRLRAERVSSQATYVSELVFAAWAQRP